MDNYSLFFLMIVTLLWLNEKRRFRAEKARRELSSETIAEIVCGVCEKLNQYTQDYHKSEGREKAENQSSVIALAWALRDIQSAIKENNVRN